jgi:hypothetical protein
MAVVGASVVASAALLGHAAVASFRIHHAEKRVTVTGSASRRIRSDLVVWRATVKSQAPQMAAAYKKLAADVPALVAFIKERGIDDKGREGGGRGRPRAPPARQGRPRNRGRHERLRHRAAGRGHLDRHRSRREDVARSDRAHRSRRLHPVGRAALHLYEALRAQGADPRRCVEGRAPARRADRPEQPARASRGSSARGWGSCR